MPARGAAFGDLSNDGHIDVVLNVMDSTPVLLRNVVKNTNHWLTLKLVRGLKSLRDAIGAKVFVTAGAIRQRGDVFSGGSYACSSDQFLHFGLGAATSVEKVEILWPDGVKEEIKIPAIDRIVTVAKDCGSLKLESTSEKRFALPGGISLFLLRRFVESEIVSYSPDFWYTRT
jgi:enediyne biosynthesis protein E4